MGPVQHAGRRSVEVQPGPDDGMVVLVVRDGPVSIVAHVRADELMADASRVSGVPLVVGVAELAKLAELAPQTIRKYLAMGDLPRPVLRLGQSPAWSVASVRDWLLSRREGTPC